MEARIASIRDSLESELDQAFDNAVWHAVGMEGGQLTPAGMNGLASYLAGQRFGASPWLHSELLNRARPSSSAVAAQNVLLHRMVLHEGEERLGIKGFPAEAGLFTSLLKNSGLYRETLQGWRFAAPPADADDRCNLGPAWEEATRLLESNSHRTVPVSEIYEVWREQPLGIKDGLLPVLAAAFILSRRRETAFYRQGVFQARVTDLDMDYLAKNPGDIQLRWMDFSEGSRQLLADMAVIVRTLDPDNKLPDLEPIDVAKGLISIHDRLEPWTGRTQRLSSNAKRVRQIFKQASDPNSFIFDDLPRSLSDELVPGNENLSRTVSNKVHEGLTELGQAYPAMLHRLRETLLAELQVPNASAPMLSELRARSENVRDLSGDHRMEAFVMRLAQFYGTDTDMESLASMAANKPLRSWVDSDIDQATVELADMAQRFMRMESFAHVKGRSDKRHAMAVTVGIGGRPATVHDEFNVTSLDRPDVEQLVSDLKEAVQTAGEGRRNVILAALAELSADYLYHGELLMTGDETTTKRAVEYGR